MKTFVDHLVESRTSFELAKELVKLTKENIKLKDKALAFEVELFWIKAKERKPIKPIVYQD